MATLALPENQYVKKKSSDEYWVRLYIHCPKSKVLGDRNRADACEETEPNLWWHSTCGGATFIDENGDVQCECPGGQGILFGCSFRCGQREEVVAKFNLMDALQGLNLAEQTMFTCLNDGTAYTPSEEDQILDWLDKMKKALRRRRPQ